MPRTALPLLAAFALVVGLTAWVQAQPAPATKPVIPRGGILPPTLKTLPSLTAAQQEQIRKFVKTEGAAMAAGDPAILTAARRNLILSSHMLQAGKPAQATPVFQQVYGAALNDALVEQFKHADARVRLNAAVTLANVAAQMGQGTSLFKAAQAALQDKAEPVVMWGVRASKDIYPNLLDVNKAQAAELAKGIIEATRRFPNRTPIAEDAFTALTGTTITSNKTRAGAALSSMIDLLQARAQAYSKVAPGALPEEDVFFPARPELDAPVMAYLSITGWGAMTPAQKAAAGRAIHDQAQQLVRLAPLLQRKVAGDVAPRLDDLIKELRNITSSLQVLGKNAAAPEITNSAIALNRLATLTPAQPLMMAELANLTKAMSDAKLLAAPPAAPGTPGTAPAAATNPSVAPAAPTQKPSAPAALNK